MTDTDMIRTPAPRPPYQQPQSQNPIVRPHLNQSGPRQMLPQQQQQQQQNLMATTNGQQQQRPAPSPLRRLDSKGNIIMNPGQPRPPGQPQMNRPPLPPSSAPNPGLQQQQQRPPLPQQTNWSTQVANQQQQRPQFQPNNNPQQQQQQNPQMRPPFPRAPGQHPVSAPNQPPFRPPFPQHQQQQQPPQQQQQQLQQQQTLQPQGRPIQVPRTVSSEQIKPPPITNLYQNNNEDDDDVVIGQAITPQKTINKPGTGLISNPMTQSQYGTLMDDNKSNESYSTRITNQKNEINSSQNYKDLVDDQPRTTKLMDNKTRENVNLEQLNIYGNKPPPGQLQLLTKKQLEESQDFSSVGKQQQHQSNINQKQQPLKQQQSVDMNHPDRHSSAIQQKTYTELKKNKKGDNDSGVDESTQGNERNGPASPGSPLKTPTQSQSGISRPPSATPSSKSTKSRSASRSRLLLKTPEPEPPKKVPMNKVKVGNAPSPDLKAVRSKIGSLDNSSYKPGGGNVRIANTKIHIKPAAPRIEAKNDKYVPQGGDKKITSTKLQWNAKSKINSLENANHKPGGGDKKIETLKPDFKDKAKPKVGSKDNVKYVPGGGDIKTKSAKESTNQSDIQTQKIDIKAQSKIGSMENVKHKPGGGDKKIFDDKDYLKNVDHPVALTQPTQDPPAVMTESSGADENLNKQQS